MDDEGERKFIVVRRKKSPPQLRRNHTTSVINLVRVKIHIINELTQIAIRSVENVCSFAFHAVIVYLDIMRQMGRSQVCLLLIKK